MRLLLIQRAHVRVGEYIYTYIKRPIEYEHAAMAHKIDVTKSSAGKTRYAHFYKFPKLYNCKFTRL